MKKTFLTIGCICFAFSMISCDPSSKKKEDVNVELLGINNSISELEAEVVKLFESANIGSIDDDKREQIFKMIDEKLVSILEKPESKDYLFEELNGYGVSIVTSEDGNLRVFSWDDLSGGSMINYTNLFQFTGDDIPVVEILHTSQESADILTSNFDQIYSLDIDNERHYLVLGIQKTGGISTFEILQAISVQGNTLNFNDNIISVNGVSKNNIFSANEMINVNPERFITYDNNTKVITQIEVDENDAKTVNKFTFDGKIFK